MNPLATKMQEFARASGADQQEGSVNTNLEGVYFYHDSVGCQRKPLLYQSGIIIMGQGHKNVYLGDHCVTYGRGDYLVLGVPLPLECEAFCDGDKPILGLTIDVPPSLLHEMVSELAQRPGFLDSQASGVERGLESVHLIPELEQGCLRLLDVLHDEVEAKILGAGLVREIIYRVLMGPHGHVLIGLAQHDGQYARIARVLTKLHTQYAQAMTVESMANDAHMSVSSFHRAFRQVTLVSPLQYLKKVRLSKARALISSGGHKMGEVAELVGYSSATQFNREFRRHFNETPKSVAG